MALFISGRALSPEGNIVIDLTCWNWTGPKTDPKTKKPYRLETGQLCLAQSKQTNIPDQLAWGKDEFGDYIEFIAISGAVDSATTENTKYPRSELRQTLSNGDDKEANWTPPKHPQSLYGKLRIMSLAKLKKAILGQIHGDPSENPPLKIQVTGDTVYAQLRKVYEGKEDKPALGKIVEGQIFTYRVDVFDDYTVDIYFNEQLVIEKYQFDAASYAKDTWYWKAGVYSQDDAKTGSGTGRVRFYELVVGACTRRTIAVLANEVDQAVKAWQKHTWTDTQSLAKIQDIKVEADTDFEKTKERSDLYEQIRSARTLIRG